MHIFVVRHGAAEGRSPSRQDQDRRLDARGHAEAAWLAQRIASSGRPPRVIISSPLTRALETAQYLEKSGAAEVHTDPRLEPDEPVAGVIALLREHAGREPVALVGHNPQLSALVGLLTSGIGPPARELRTGEAAVLDIDPSSPLGDARSVEFLRAGE